MPADLPTTSAINNPQDAEALLTNAHPTSPASTVAHEGNKLAVERIGATVVFTLRLRDHYEAMALYDKACAALNETGTVQLSVDGATRVPR